MNARIPVRLRHSDAAAGLAPDAFLEAVREAATRTLEALAVPAEPVLERGEPLPAGAAGPVYDLAIGGAPARLSWADVPPDAEAMRERIGYEITRNADLFVTPVVADLLRKQWNHDGARPPAAELAPDRLLDLLRESVRLGCGLNRIRDAEPAGDERDPPEWRILEAALDSAISLRIGVPVGFHGDESAEATSDSLRDAAHARAGVILPQVQFQETDRVRAQTLELGALDVTCVQPAGAEALPAAERIVAALEPWLASFVTRETVLFKLLAASRQLPRLAGAVRARYGDAFLTRTCRILVADGIGFPDVRGLLGGLLEIREPTTADETRHILFHSPAGTPPPELALADQRLDPEDAADCIRRWTRRLVATRHWQAGSLQVRLLDPDLERTFRAGAIRPGSDAQRRFLERLAGSADPLLTNVDVRRRVSDALSFERPDVTVLCYQELLPDCNITPVERISL